jgi:hypothetical protein
MIICKIHVMAQVSAAGKWTYNEQYTRTIKHIFFKHNYLY